MDYQITSWCRRLLQEHVREGSFCIDATMGNGNDTAWLCQLAGKQGRVLAFDIQPQAVENTRKKLESLGCECPYELILDSHSNMAKYAEYDSADCIVFNLGYLPGGDHSIATNAETTIQALEQGLKILNKNGLMSVCIYSGGDSGFEERDAVLAWMKTLNPKKYLVLVTQYFNRPNNPPIPAAIIRL